jgi:hypothetical protein
MMPTFETSTDRSKEDAAADRLGEYWRGNIITSTKYMHHDRQLIENGQRKAIAEIKCRTYSIDYFIEHDYMISAIKVARLQTTAGLHHIVPLIMVSCSDDDFLLDLRDETYRIETRRVNDRATTHAGVVMRDEAMCFFRESRFIPISAVNTLIA